MPVKSMAKLLMMGHGVLRDLQVVRRARKIILNMIERKHKKGYENLPKYSEMLKATNLGSVTFIKWQQLEEAGQRPFFQRLFMCYNACKEGFLKGLRKLIGLDGCHLKGAYQETLLLACGLDGDIIVFKLHLLWLIKKVKIIGSTSSLL